MKQLIGLFLKTTNKKHMKGVIPTVKIRWLVFFYHFQELLHRFSMLV